MTRKDDSLIRALQNPFHAHLEGRYAGSDHDMLVRFDEAVNPIRFSEEGPELPQPILTEPQQVGCCREGDTLCTGKTAVQLEEDWINVYNVTGFFRASKVGDIEKNITGVVTGQTRIYQELQQAFGIPSLLPDNSVNPEYEQYIVRVVEEARKIVTENILNISKGHGCTLEIVQQAGPLIDYMMVIADLITTGRFFIPMRGSNPELGETRTAFWDALLNLNLSKALNDLLTVTDKFFRSIASPADSVLINAIMAQIEYQLMPKYAQDAVALIAKMNDMGCRKDEFPPLREAYAAEVIARFDALLRGQLRFGGGGIYGKTVDEMRAGRFANTNDLAAFIEAEVNDSYLDALQWIAHDYCGFERPVQSIFTFAPFVIPRTFSRADFQMAVLPEFKTNMSLQDPSPPESGFDSETIKKQIGEDSVGVALTEQEKTTLVNIGMDEPELRTPIGTFLSTLSVFQTELSEVIGQGSFRKGDFGPLYSASERLTEAARTFVGVEYFPFPDLLSTIFSQLDLLRAHIQSLTETWPEPCASGMAGQREAEYFSMNQDTIYRRMETDFGIPISDRERFKYIEEFLQTQVRPIMVGRIQRLSQYVGCDMMDLIPHTDWLDYPYVAGVLSLTSVPMPLGFENASEDQIRTILEKAWAIEIDTQIHSRNEPVFGSTDHLLGILIYGSMGQMSAFIDQGLRNLIETGMTGLSGGMVEGEYVPANVTIIVVKSVLELLVLQKLAAALRIISHLGLTIVELKNVFGFELGEAIGSAWNQLRVTIGRLMAGATAKDVAFFPEIAKDLQTVGLAGNSPFGKFIDVIQWLGGLISFTKQTALEAAFFAKANMLVEISRVLPEEAAKRIQSGEIQNTLQLQAWVEGAMNEIGQRFLSEIAIQHGFQIGSSGDSAITST